jgi:hypothetical protein
LRRRGKTSVEKFDFVNFACRQVFNAAFRTYGTILIFIYIFSTDV